MNDLRQLALLEQQAVEYYKDGDYSGVVCALVKAIEDVGLYTKVVPRNKSYEVYVSAAPSTASGAVVRIYKVGGLQRALDVLMGTLLPTYHVSHDSELVGQPCTITVATAPVQGCFP
jgi:hypothetical protein